jgi:hypothetical protein
MNRTASSRGLSSDWSSAISIMPPDFDDEIHVSIEKAISRNMRLLEAGLEEL